MAKKPKKEKPPKKNEWEVEPAEIKTYMVK